MMRNSNSKLHRMATRVVWASLIVCACLLVGGALAFAQEKTTTTERNTKYGEGGKEITTTTKADYTVTNVKIIDGKGVVREEYYTYVSKLTGKKERESLSYYDCKGNLTYHKEVGSDTFGNETDFAEAHYKDGKKISGYETRTDENGKKTSKRYNSKTDKYEDVALEAGPTSEEISTPPPDTTVCNACKANEIVGEGQLIREDAQPNRFNTYGFAAEYSRFIGQSNIPGFRRCHVAVTGDFNANFRTINGADLTKTSILGGITFIPFGGALPYDKVTFSAHALFGISHFSSTAGSVTSTDNAFTMKLGGAVDVNVTKKFFIRVIQIDYAPTFFGGNTQNNFQVGFGAGFRF